MTDRKLTNRQDATRRQAPPASGASLPSSELSKRQGTNSVHGTCTSEGEAGRHLSCLATYVETLSLTGTGTMSPKPMPHPR